MTDPGVERLGGGVLSETGRLFSKQTMSVCQPICVCVLQLSALLSALCEHKAEGVKRSDA